MLYVSLEKLMNNKIQDPGSLAKVENVAYVSTMVISIWITTLKNL